MSEGRWRDADRDIYYDTEQKGRRISVRANAEYLNALEVELSRTRESNDKLRAGLNAERDLARRKSREDYYRKLADTAEERWKSADAEITNLQEQLRAAEAALTHIKTDCGKVCEEYEICTHIACQSSYNAWAIADGYLTQQPEKE